MKVVVTLDDISPLISYHGDWRAGSSASDDKAGLYSNNGTFSVTQSNNASATLNFVGTNVTVYGSKRFNHNVFTTTLDGGAPVSATGHPNGDDEFQVPLYASPALVHESHTLVIQDASTDSTQPFLDIDFVIIETQVDGDSTAVIEDGASYWIYDPADAWSTNFPKLSGFSSGTGHSTSHPGASASLTFSGSAIDLYGLVCDTCGAYWVSLDGGAPQTFSAVNQAWTRPQQMLYMARGLSDGNHTLKVTNLGYPAQGSLNIDFVTIYGTQPRGLAVHAVNATGSDAQRTGSFSKPMATAGTIVAAVLIPIFIILLGLILLLWQRRRRGWPFNTPRVDESLSPYPRTVTPVQQCPPLCPPLVIPGHHQQQEQQPAAHPYAASSVVSGGQPISIYPVRSAPSGYPSTAYAPSEYPATTVPSVYPATEAGPESSGTSPTAAPRAGPGSTVSYPFTGFGSGASSGDRSPGDRDGLPEYRESPSTPQRAMWQQRKSSGVLI
ncbi:hypothetical protein EXIGLDRAFT_721753 [Exidia glandulosa HHB12029]|uniref:Transmembrane protein n=1 Tax=Exidia glandulosa HHB12029 TaxID=1314781 RepID=A0A165QFL5_EXIGL|nr:hypothetical protein EXIGLDRAFT_721753 [Exidia glandulosa HHB12029]